MQVRRLLEWLQEASASVGPRRFTLSTGRDGIMVPMAKKSNYREASTATLSVLDRSGRRLGTVYLGQMPEAGQTTLSTELTALITDVLSRCKGAMPRLTYVTDCGHHPTEYFTNVLQRIPDPRNPSKVLPWSIDHPRRTPSPLNLSQPLILDIEQVDVTRLQAVAMRESLLLFFRGRKDLARQIACFAFGTHPARPVHP